MSEKGPKRNPGHPSRMLLPCLLVFMSSLFVSCAPNEDDRIPLVVHVGGRSMSKLAFVIAQDQGLP